MSGADSRPTRIAWAVLLAVTLAWFLTLLHRGAALAPDEIEFFRATKWVGEGRVPFRDFWEHHTPLQWMVFAPVARLFADGPGAGSVVLLRWAQIPFWLLAFALLARSGRFSVAAVMPASALLFSSRTFVDRALEYRVDIVGNVAFIAALAVALARPGRRGYMAFGTLMSLAVLANMRMVPLTVMAALLLLVWRPGEERWRWNPQALWMTAGVGATTAAFVLWLILTGAWDAFAEAMFRYNRMSGESLAVQTFGDALIAPLWRLDVGGIAFWIAGVAGCVLALARIRSAGRLQILALLAVASVLSLMLMAVQYDYHLQTTWLLLLPIVTSIYGRLNATPWRVLALVITSVSLLVFLSQSLPDFGAELRYQDEIMRAADASTSPGDHVLDGAGHALRREPAYRYWFLTTGVRMLAANGGIDAYGLEEIRDDPPAAVIFDYRLGLYLEQFPRLAAYVTRHYVPWYRNLWLPGLGALTKKGVTRVDWTVQHAGEYELFASESLVGHPWFTHPFDYARAAGPTALQLAIPLRRLSKLPRSAIRVTVDGRIVDALEPLVLKRGGRVEIVITSDRDAAVLLVPHGIDVLGLAPAEEFVF